MKLVTQPKGSYLCGQSSVAMVLGITLDESIKLFGHKKATRFKEYKKILNDFNVRTDSYKTVDNRRKYKLPNKALVRIEKVGRRMGHVVVHVDGKFYDPMGKVYNSKDEMLEDYSNRGYKWRLRGYMALEDKGEELLASGD